MKGGGKVFAVGGGWILPRLVEEIGGFPKNMIKCFELKCSPSFLKSDIA